MYEQFSLFMPKHIENERQYHFSNYLVWSHLLAVGDKIHVILNMNYKVSSIIAI